MNGEHASQHLLKVPVSNNTIQAYFVLRAQNLFVFSNVHILGKK